MNSKILSVAIVAVCCRFGIAATYYVSPAGDDSSNGQSQNKPWKTCEKVNTTRFKPGDTILFQRGGEWREHLQPDSDGAENSPITYDAFGTGPKPEILGSDLLDNTRFTPAGDNKYTYPLNTQADSALADHAFIPSTWASGTLTLTTTTDPRTDKKIYTACTRGNVIFSNGKNHIVFRNLIADETAGHLNDGPNQGYGVRIEGSTDVLVESCEANRCGRHNFAAINSTGFVGRHLRAAYVVPNMPGGNTAYVSYADTGAPVASCVHEWDDIACEHMEDGKGGTNLMFVSHGDNQGMITIENSVVADNKISFMSAPAALKHTVLKGNGTIENFGKGVLLDGLTLLGSSTIDQYGSDGIIQNCLANLTPTGGGPTGYGTAIVCRDKANGNTIRFNTLVTKNFSCLELAGSNSKTKSYGNIMIADGNTIAKGSGALDGSDLAISDFNFYAPSASFGGKTLGEWQRTGLDKNSMSGDPKFKDAAKGKFNLKAGSPCLHAAKVDASQIPATDLLGKSRPTKASSMGAFGD